jgi:hypothetical protein
MPQNAGLRRELFTAFAFLTALTIIITWPQALYLGTKVPAHDDPLLSMWRLGWIAHALQTSITHLFDGNIFYPYPRTLAFSDATLFEGLLAAPWLWAHVNPVLVYNVVLLGGIVSSGLGMFVLARYLTASEDAALVAATIFTLAPYRIEHFMHLELQWTVWIPLTFWAVHRCFDTGSVRNGLLAGGLLSLQVISCLYYGGYLALIASVLALLLALALGHFRHAVIPLLLGAAIPVLLVVLYAAPYVDNARVLGARDPSDIANFSGQVASYFAAPQQNWLWGWTAFQFNGNELRLFPGTVAVALALLAFAQRNRPRLVWVYGAVTALAVELSLGLNGPLYRWLHAHLWVLQGFRAPARFGIFACSSLAVLAAFGLKRLQQLTLGTRFQKLVLPIVLVAVGLESGSAPMHLIDVPLEVPSVYKFLASASRSAGRSVVVELPIVDTDAASMYMFCSTWHWIPLVNGYSGFTPPAYKETVERMRTFPDDAAIRRLQELDVRYILVHESLYAAKEYTSLMVRLAQRPELMSVGKFRDWTMGATQVFQFSRVGTQ